MDITPLVRAGQSIIQSYHNGGFRIGRALYEGPVLVFPDRVEAWDLNAPPPDFAAQDFAPLWRADPKPDVVLLGTGGRQVLLSPQVRAALRDNGLAVEAMNTGAACRTYNVLLAEGRRVAAALAPVVHILPE